MYMSTDGPAIHPGYPYAVKATTAGDRSPERSRQHILFHRVHLTERQPINRPFAERGAAQVYQINDALARRTQAGG